MVWTSCPAGQYVEKRGTPTVDQSCAPCPPGQRSTSQNALSCIDEGACPAGTVQTAPATATLPPSCVACLVGTFCAGGRTASQACTGDTWDHDGNPASACLARTSCGPGHSVAADGNAITDRTCAACPSGTYASDTNAATCSDWTPCQPGQYATLSGSPVRDRACASCPSGQSSATVNVGQCTTWQDCGAAQYVGNTPSATTDRLCTDCGAGTFTTQPNQTVCLPQGVCPAGTEQVGALGPTQAAHCVACPPGTYCAGGDAVTQACTGDSWDDDASAATACVPRTGCGPGQEVTGPGSAVSDRACGPCPQGSYSAGTNVGSCTPWTVCDAGAYVTAAGTSTSNRSCAPCASGRFAIAQNAAACPLWTDCAPGQYVTTPPSSSVDRACAACATDTFSEQANQSMCLPQGACAAGTEQTVAGTAGMPPVCVACPAGTYCPGAITPREPCAADTWDHDGGSSTACVARSDCAAGQSVTSDGDATINRTCAACVAGSYSGGTNTVSCTTWTSCQPGQSIGTPGTATTNELCVGCASGRFSSASDAPVCELWADCAAGKHVTNTPSTTVDRTCADCAAGAYTAQANQAICLPEDACAAGTEQTAPGTSTMSPLCGPCSIGTYCSGGSSPPQPCAGNTWDHDGTAATACAAWTDCTAGQAVTLAGSATTNRTCDACATGSYSSGTNTVTCTTSTSCPAGQYVGTPGTSTTDKTCVDCGAGTFTTIPNEAMCDPWVTCAAGRYVTNIPSTSLDRTCADCPAGFYTALANQSMCLPRINDAPIGAADLLSSVFQNSCLQVISGSALTGNDNRGAPDEGAQTLTVVSVAAPVGGTVVLNGSNVEFTPTLNYTGAAGFTYIAQDNGTTSGAADFKSTQATTVSFTIVVLTTAPVAVDDLATVAQNSAATPILVLANDTAAGTATIASATQPAYGAVVIAGNGSSLTYAPNLGYCNDPPGTATTTDTFVYTLSPAGDAGVVSVTVTCGGATTQCGNGTCGTGETTGSCPADCGPKSFDGLGSTISGSEYPPKANGDVGPTYYIQAINGSIGIFRKTDGVRVDTFSFNTLMSQGNFGNLCDTNNMNDPVVLYDSFEDRWIITDVAYTLDGSNNVINPPGSFECMAVSRTGDPVSGGWYFYSINVAGGLGAYPKFGVWPDGLYMSVNMYSHSAARTYLNPRVYAFNKDQMYAGAPTVQSITFDAPPTDFTLLPSNARLQTGTPPPGSPNYFVSTWIYRGKLSVYKFIVDWTRVSQATFSAAEYSLAGISWPNAFVDDAPSLGGNALEVVQFRAMMQNQYTNIAGAESLWTTHTVRRGDTSGFAAPRWYQTDVTGGTVAPNLLQAATWDPDGANVMHRFLPSLAVDRMGDLALGYTTSSSTTRPAIKYAGRLAADPINTFSQAETVLIQSTGTQVGDCGVTPCNKWGDYSSMSLDRDGCTFWLTGQYYAVDGLSYSTRIGSFIFPSCTRIGDGGTLSGLVTDGVTSAAIGGATVALGSRTTTTNAFGVYTFLNLPAGTYPSITASLGQASSTATSIVVADAATTTQDLSLAPVVASACSADTSAADFLTGVLTSVATTGPGDVVLYGEIVDQENTTTGTGTGTLSITTWGGQTFTPPITGRLLKADIKLLCSACSGTTPNLTLSLRATSGGFPTGADLAAATIPGFASVTPTFYTGTFASPPILTAGTKYALVVRPVTNPSAGSYGVPRSGTPGTGADVYAGGARIAGATSGTVWSSPLTASISTDAGFRTYMDSVVSGDLVSAVKVADPTVSFTPTWSTLSWTAVTAASTSVQFHAAASNNLYGPFVFVGPDGTASSFFTSGASLSQFNGFRYLKYKALLATTDLLQTPTLNDVTVCATANAAPQVCVP
jgi:hypothetical protein